MARERTIHSQKTSVVIIGAGVSGICMAIDLIRRVGTRDFILLERDDDFGGTWHNNRYPGSCADAHSYLYCFSFAPNYNCKKTYPSRRELHSYLVDVTRRWELGRHVLFNTAVEKAVWESDNEWSVYKTSTQDTEAGKSTAYRISCRYLISAVGQLHTAHVPEIPGLKEYEGKVMHTANWDEDERLEGRRVAVIGNGATGVQIVPEVASRAKHLTVFQRSPSWIIPRNSQALPKIQQILYQYVPAARRYYRSHILKDQDARHGMVVNERDREMGAQFSKDFLTHQLPLDPDLQARLTPSYPFGCKRVLLSDDFYPAISQAHVALETRPIERITKHGVQIENAELPFDLLIFATGFHAQSFLSHIEILGKSRQKICSDRRHGLRAHQGVAVEDLPNFAMLYGPNTNLSHVSVMLVIEAQARYISAMVRVVQQAAKVCSSGLGICPKPQAVADYNDALQAWLKKTVFAEPGCRSWYRAEDGVVTNNWPGTAIQYQNSLSVLNWDDYDMVGSEVSSLMKRGAQSLGGPLENPLASTRLGWMYGF